MRNAHHYRVTIEHIHPEEETTIQSMQLALEERDDMFAIVDKMKQSSGLEANTAARFAVGLKLLGPVMMEQRKNPLFAELMPHFGRFMGNLKRKLKAASLPE